MSKVWVNPAIFRVKDILVINQKDMNKMAKRVDIKFRANERRLFSTQGSSGGRRWKPLNPGYRKWKRKKRPGRKIMTFDGKLRDSLTKKGFLHVAIGFMKRGLFGRKGFIQVGTHDIKAAWHGPPNRLKNSILPTRDVLQQTPQQIDQYRQEIWKVMRGKFERARRAIAKGAR